MIPDLSGGRGKTLHVLSHSTGTLQIAPWTLRCCPFGIITIFSKTIRCAIRTCSSFSNDESSLGICQQTSSTNMLLQTAWQGILFFNNFE